MCVIADPQRAIGLAGVMGGRNSEVTASTTRVLLESAYFRSGGDAAHVANARAQDGRRVPLRARRTTIEGLVGAGAPRGRAHRRAGRRQPVARGMLDAYRASGGPSACACGCRACSACWAWRRRRRPARRILTAFSCRCGRAGRDLESTSRASGATSRSRTTWSRRSSASGLRPHPDDVRPRRRRARARQRDRAPGSGSCARSSSAPASRSASPTPSAIPSGRRRSAPRARSSS